MKTTTTRAARKGRKKKAARHRWVVTRNGMPCAVQSIHCRVDEFGFVFHGRVAVPLPLPPVGPYQFRKKETAKHVAERSRTLGLKLRDSIFRAQIVSGASHLAPFGVDEVYAVTPHEGAS